VNPLRTGSTAQTLSIPTVAYNEPPVSPVPINIRTQEPAPQFPAAVPAPQAPAPQVDSFDSAPAVVPPAEAPVPAAVPTPAPAPTPPAPAPAFPPAEPVAAAPLAPASVAEPQPATPAPAPAQSVAIFLHLTSGERIFAARLASEEEATERARAIVRALVRPEPGVWAKFGDRLVRPDSVVSIELAKRRDD
jgi:hypothetical protein